jgi:hypothetical protein
LAFGLDFLSEERELQVASAAAGDAGRLQRSPEQAALANFSHVMLNLNEFLYIN